MMWEYNQTTDMALSHYGIKGQRWGIRRYQNPNGTLTPAGRKRYRYITMRGTLTSEGKEKYYANQKAAEKKYNDAKIDAETRQTILGAKLRAISAKSASDRPVKDVEDIKKKSTTDRRIQTMSTTMNITRDLDNARIDRLKTKIKKEGLKSDFDVLVDKNRLGRTGLENAILNVIAGPGASTTYSTIVAGTGNKKKAAALVAATAAIPIAGWIARAPLNAIEKHNYVESKTMER